MRHNYYKREGMNEELPTAEEMLSIMEKVKRAAYWEGVKHGLRQFAWWKDGVQYVGTCGKTLEDALFQINLEDPVPNKMW